MSWQPSEVQTFWDYECKRPGATENYFSHAVGAGITNLLARLNVLRGRVLDFGCGPGFLCERIAKKGFECWGCDRSPTSVAAANERLAGVPTWKGAWVLDSTHAGDLTSSFDLVTLIETVEHLSDADERSLFSDVATLLRPGGHLFVTTPNRENLHAGMILCPFCRSEYHRMQHVRAFDAATLAATLQKAGFEVVLATAVNFAEFQLPAWPGLLDVSMREIARSLRRIGRKRLPARLMSRGHGKAGLVRESAGPHLFALVRKPAHS